MVFCKAFERGIFEKPLDGMVICGSGPNLTLELQCPALQIEKLKVQLARLRRMKFGQSSERLALEANQLELTLEDLEAEHAHAECVIEGHVPDDTPAATPKRKPRSAPLPEHLPRDEIVHPAPDADDCSACGGVMGALGEDITEVLEYVPAHFASYAMFGLIPKGVKPDSRLGIPKRLIV